MSDPAETKTGDLDTQLESEIARIHADPLAIVGFGGKSFMPYELAGGIGLVTSVDRRVTPRLLADARNPQVTRTARLALLHVMAFREDPDVDRALIACLDDPELRGLAAFLIGRIGFKGYPKRERDTPALLAALGAHLDDAGMTADPWYRKSFRISDFVLGAVIRLVGPERFRFGAPDLAEFVGWELPRWNDAERTSLTTQAHAILGR
jgi:hypothetical protein